MATSVFWFRSPEVNGGEDKQTKTIQTKFNQSGSEWRRGGANENKPDKVQSIGEEIKTLPQVTGKTN